MINLDDFRGRIVRPVLAKLVTVIPATPAAEALVIGTALAESGLRRLVQQGGGPALGLYQMEPATHDDIWRSYLAFRPPLRRLVADIGGRATRRTDDLVWNLAYATAMARIHYWRAAPPLPGASDLGRQARYWKRFYNTEAGRGTPEHYVAAATAAGLG